MANFLINWVAGDTNPYVSHSTYHAGDSGLDLFAIKDLIIEPGKTELVDLGVQCRLQKRTLCPYYWIKNRSFYKYSSYLMMPRSSIYKTPLLLHNSVGLIDSEYTGNIKAPLYNSGLVSYTITKGERLVQLVQPDLKSISFKLVDSHNTTTRGSNGFGSTGV